MASTAVMRRRRRRRLVAPLLVAGAAALLLIGHATRSTGEEVPGAPSAQPWLGVLDQGGTLVDASPEEAKGEVWSIGAGRILRYTDADGWSALPAPRDAAGQPIEKLTPAGGTLQARATRDGAVALLADDALIVRDPGGEGFRAAPGADRLPDGTLPTTSAPPTTSTPPTTSAPQTTSAPATTSAPGSTTAPPPTTAAAALHDGEKLYDTPLVVALSERGRAGAFVVPTAGDDRRRDAVLHFDGTAWTREPICLGAAPDCPDVPERFAVVAIDAAGSDHAWLLASGSADAAGLVLLHRSVEGGDAVWREASLGSSPFANASATLAGGDTATITPRTTGQPLVATTAGVWADAAVKVGSDAPQGATLFYGEDDHAVRATWCDAGAPLCDRALGTSLSTGDGRSFAWNDGSGPYGARLITGLDQGAMLRLDGERFTRVATAGRGAGAQNGAAFAAPDDGWLGGNGIVARYGRALEAGRLRQWPVPFRHPLTAIAAEPGKAVGAIDSQALAVGDQGEVVRYVPGQGWSPEALLGATGKRATPRLRGVAWPAPDRAYAVGDGGEMWLWRKATGLWEPDPGKPATTQVAIANFTGVAFDPSNPARGYAIGKQGVLLRYDRQWTQEPLPDGLGDANLTSIAFAGRQAIITYKTPIRTDEGDGYRGGIIVNDGSGWHEDPSLLGALPKPSARGDVIGIENTPERVAGLPEGSAVVASMTGALATRDGAGGAWRAADVDPVGFPSALSAFHDADGAVRAIVSAVVESKSSREAPYVQRQLRTDQETILQPAPTGQAPVLTNAYDLPPAGYVLRQTAHGWRDEQHQAWVDQRPNLIQYDLPEQPDPELALLTDPFGRGGWAVGGDATVQTASVVRYPDDGQSAPGASSAPVPADPAVATFAVGGGAGCLGACADLEPVGVAPWRWLPAAVGRAAQIDGLRAFLDTGPGTAGATAVEDFAHEQAAAADRLTSAAGALPVYAAAGASDRAGDGDHALDVFLGAFGAASAPLGARPAQGISSVAAPGSGHAYYGFDSTGAAGTVRVAVLDTSAGNVGDTQRCWLSEQLANAAGLGTPVIVMGADAVDALGDGPQLAQTLVSGTTGDCPSGRVGASASAYFYNAPERNRISAVTAGNDAIRAFGTGSLGYMGGPPYRPDQPLNSGFLLAQVDVARRDEANNRAPVGVRLIPNIAELAVDATDGTLLRRSQIALFEGLARRPRSGQGCVNGPNTCQIVPDPYTPIPDDCNGPACATTLTPEFRFTSSNPSVADFVARDPASTNPRRPLLNEKGDPVPDGASGLLCAYNAGTATITLTSGGLSYSQKVTVQEGSVQRPCGTVPANQAPKERPAGTIPTTEDPPALPPEDDPPVGGGGLVPPPPVPAPKAAAKTKPSKPRKAATSLPVSPFLPVASGLTQVVAAPPPPPPTAARPAPPSGTSSANVYQNAVAPEKQREEEHQIETAQNAVRYEADRPLPIIVSHGGALLLIVLAGLAFADLRPRARPRPAYNTIDNDRRDPRTPR